MSLSTLSNLVGDVMGDVNQLISRLWPTRRTTLISLGTIGLVVVSLPFVQGFVAFLVLRSSQPKGIRDPSDAEFGDRSNDEVLDATGFREFKLIESVAITPNTRRLRFLIPGGGSLYLPPGYHVQVGIADPAHPGRIVKRFYSPVSDSNAKGYFDLVVKAYPGGIGSQFLTTLPVGEHALVRGPTGSYQYKPNEFTHIGMLAGGTGITPLLQLIRVVLSNPAEMTSVTLLFANNTVDDIIMKDELDQLAVHAPARFQVHYVVTHHESPEKWRGTVGHITENLVREHFFLPQERARVCVCGPAGMVSSMRDICRSIGYRDEMLYVF